MNEEEIINLLKLFSRALELAVDGDKDYGMELLKTASKELDIPIPVVACLVPDA